MRLYFDCEMSSLSPSGVLLSIGIVSEDKKRFYAEVEHDEPVIMDDWVKENVVDKMVLNADGVKNSNFPKDLKDLFAKPGDVCINQNDTKTKIVRGSHQFIRDCLLSWMHTFIELGHKIEFVSDCANSTNGDWHHLLTLIAKWKDKTITIPVDQVPYIDAGQAKKMMEELPSFEMRDYVGVPIMPEGVVPICDDIVYKIKHKMGRTLEEAWDVNRESLVKDYLANIMDVFGSFPEKEEDFAKHNSLWDAEIIRLIDMQIK